ncbi:hypothetical protein [Saccharopolyspora sp. CA-218241]|uniref:hypothetical protein n=1 Tax=Saccharopolyspora sp. CA-218241 TaxID=3240027 RepID=UPI003D97E5E2
MRRLSPASGAVPLVTGIVAATALSGAAVVAVLRSGCDDPGVYEARDGVVELIGGCLHPDDLPVTTRDPEQPMPLGGTEPAQAR